MMQKVVALCRAQGWHVIEVDGDRVTIAVPPTEISRLPARVCNAFLARGVVLHEAKPPIELPCAWVEFDLATLRCRLHIVVNDSFLR
jgi:hypothetical protein